MSERTKKDNEVCSCMVGLWLLLVVHPMRLALLFGILLSIPDVPIWCWVLYWTFVPVVMLGSILTEIVKAIKK